jgi:hypothetical protein
VKRPPGAAPGLARGVPAGPRPVPRPPPRPGSTLPSAPGKTKDKAAPKKPKKALMEMNRQALAMAAAAIVVSAVSLVLLYAGFMNLMRRLKFEGALKNADTFRASAAKDDARSLVGWDASNPEPKILLARLHAEDDEYADAESLYEEVLKLPELPEHPDSYLQANLGQGVVALRRADRADVQDVKQIEEQLRKAEEMFKKAPGATEAKIGLAWARLLRAVRIDKKPASEARKSFEEAYAAAKGSPPTRGAAEDLHLGMALSGYDPARWNPNADKHAKAYLTYNAEDPTALFNTLIYDGQRIEFNQWKVDTPESLQATRQALDTRLLTFIEHVASKSTDQPILREAVIAYAMSAIVWYVEHGFWDRARDTHVRFMRRAQFSGTIRSDQTSLLVCQGMLKGSTPPSHTTLLHATEDVGTTIKKITDDPALRAQYTALLVDAINTYAAGRYELWKIGGGEIHLNDALIVLEAAPKEAAEDYVTLRNHAYVLMGKKEQEKAESLLPRIEKAASSEAKWGADFDALKKYIQAP